MYDTTSAILNKTQLAIHTFKQLHRQHPILPVGAVKYYLTDIALHSEAPRSVVYTIALVNVANREAHSLQIQEPKALRVLKSLAMALSGTEEELAQWTSGTTTW